VGRAWQSQLLDLPQCDARPSGINLHASHTAALFGLDQRNGPASTRSEINQD
jgi:hypothetical protein